LRRILVMKKKVFVVITILALAAIGVYLVFGNNGGKESLPEVAVETAKLDTIVTTVNAKGEVSLLNSELIYSSIEAEVDEVLVEKNDVVTDGQPIIKYKEKTREKLENQLRDAQLSVRTAEIALNEAKIPPSQTTIEKARIDITDAESSIKDAKYALEQLEDKIAQQNRKILDAEKKLSDKRNLHNAGGASQYEVDSLEEELKDLQDVLTDYNKQKAQDQEKLKQYDDNLNYMKIVYEDTVNQLNTQSSKNTIALREIDLQKCRLAVEEIEADLRDFQEVIYSPIDGTVTDLKVSRGEVTPTDKVLMEISNIEDYIVKLDVNERNISKIAIGQEVVIEGSVLGKETVTGTVTKIGYIAETKTNSNGSEQVVPVEVTLDGSKDASLLKPGFSLEASITTDIKENVVVIPILSTLSESDGSSYVFIVKDDSTLEKRQVELGAYADMTVEAIGVNEGEKIVAQPTIDMYEGMKIALPADIEETQVGENEEATEVDAQ